MAIDIKEITDKNIWEDFVLSKEPDSFLQSWNWGETNKGMGEKVIRKGFYSQDRLVGVMQLIKQQAKRGPHLLLPGGPLIDFSNSNIIDAFIKEIRKIGLNENVWFIRVRPEIKDSRQNIELFESMGFINSPMHLNAENTQVLRIDKSDQEILYDMRKNTRYSVRKSLEQKLKVETTTDPKAAEILYRLQLETAQRHGFVGFQKQHFVEQIKHFGKDRQAVLFLIKDDDGSVHVAAIIIFYGKKAYYHHSASSSKSRDNYASYFLQWKVIQEARRRGCVEYNLWGVSPDLENKDHRFYGVTVFKKGFGGKQVDWLPAHDYRINHLYWTTYVFEYLRKLRRSL